MSQTIPPQLREAIAESIERVIDAARKAAEHASNEAIGRSRTKDLRELAAELRRLDLLQQQVDQLDERRIDSLAIVR